MPGDVPDPASWVAGATKSELERLLIFLATILWAVALLLPRSEAAQESDEGEARRLLYRGTVPLIPTSY